ncbi:MAG: CPBP family intramembrane metalloprotease [Anaerolineales bacterium]|nr:CPBP family intramembrane metalloprotease [Anaerolineales bacterium]
MIGFIYLLAAYSLAFYGNITINDITIISGAAQPVIFRQAIVGIVEEILFRGVILYVLVRVWGDSKRGLFLAVLVSALLFGSMHLLQAFAGRSIGVALIASLESTISGIWLGAFVILWGTIWPAAVIHAGSNGFVLIKRTSYPGLVFSYPEYFLAMLLQLPLVILGLYWLLKTTPRQVIPEIP